MTEMIENFFDTPSNDEALEDLDWAIDDLIAEIGPHTSLLEAWENLRLNYEIHVPVSEAQWVLKTHWIHHFGENAKGIEEFREFYIKGLEW